MSYDAMAFVLAVVYTLGACMFWAVFLGWWRP